VLTDLQTVIDAFPSVRVVAWGDFVGDEFLEGEIARVSREAPVLILKQRATRLVPGGGGNAAMNLAALGVAVSLVGLVGADAVGAALQRRFRSAGIETSGLVRVPGRPTPRKTRILAGHAHTSMQQVLRVDYEPEAAPTAAVQHRLVQHARRLAQHAQGVLLSDYGYGSVTPELSRQLTRHLRAGQIVTLDSRYRLAAYRGVTAATPNESEVEEAYHLRIGADRGRLVTAGERLRAELRCRWVLITRGRDGMSLFSRRQAPLHLPVHGSDQAVDVTGAGDTVIAVLTAALAAGADGATAARLANIAGGLVVMKRGTATISRAELSAAVHARPRPDAAPAPGGKRKVRR